MKLTIEELSKRTKLSIPTLRVYVSRQKLGTKVGNNRYFSQADVDKLTKGSKRGGAQKAAKPSKASRPAKAASRKTASSKPVRKPAQAAKPAAARPSAVRPSGAKPAAAPVMQKPELKTKPPRPSFWSRLFGGSRKPQKVSLMDAKKS